MKRNIGNDVVLTPLKRKTSITYDPLLMDAEELEKWKEKNGLNSESDFKIWQGNNEDKDRKAPKGRKVVESEKPGVLEIVDEDEDDDDEEWGSIFYDSEMKSLYDLNERGLDLLYDGLANFKEGLKLLKEYIVSDEFKMGAAPNFKNEVFKTWVKSTFFEDNENPKNIVKMVEDMYPLVDELEGYVCDTGEVDIVKMEDSEGVPYMEYRSMGLYKHDTDVCPLCGLRVDESARTCDCGYDFKGKSDKKFYLSKTVSANSEAIKEISKIMGYKDFRAITCEEDYDDGSYFMLEDGKLICKTSEKSKNEVVLVELVTQDGGYAFKYYPNAISKALKKNSTLVKVAFFRLYCVLNDLSKDYEEDRGQDTFYYGLVDGAIRDNDLKNKSKVSDAMGFVKQLIMINNM